MKLVKVGLLVGALLAPLLAGTAHAEPVTLDFWVANADSQNVASHARYTHYNLGELLRLEVETAKP